MAKTFVDVINMFLDGATEGHSGTEQSPGNMSIRGVQLLHYNTPILERIEGGKYIFNNTRYSLQTGRVQKVIKEKLDIDKRIDVKGVPADTKKSLHAFVLGDRQT